MALYRHACHRWRRAIGDWSGDEEIEISRRAARLVIDAGGVVWIWIDASGLAHATLIAPEGVEAFTSVPVGSAMVKQPADIEWPARINVGRALLGDRLHISVNNLSYGPAAHG